MRNRKLITSVEVGGKEYKINQDGDFRMVLDILAIFADKELLEREKAFYSLGIFYGFDIPENADEAMEQMNQFINCGEESQSTEEEPKLPVMDWEKDFQLIVSAVNPILGYDVRSEKTTHWWTFISAYMEIPEHSTFSTVVSIRTKIRDEGLSKLDKSEKKFYNANRDMIVLKKELTEEEQEWLIGE